MDHALQGFPAIDPDKLEGYIAPLNVFHSPICARYQENPETLEFDDLMSIPVTLPVTFGVVNPAKRQRRRRLQYATTPLRQTIQRLTALNRDPDAHRLVSLRISRDSRD